MLWEVIYGNSLGNKRQLMTYKEYNYRKIVKSFSYDSHSAFEITRFDCDAVYEIDGKDYDVETGDIFLMKSFVKHGIKIIKTNGTVSNIYFEPSFIWSDSSVFFDFKFLRVFLDKKNSFEYKLDKNNPSFETVNELCRELREEFTNKDTGYECMSKVIILKILVVLMRNFDYLQDSDDPDTTFYRVDIPSISRTVEYINDHIDESLPLKKLAAIANLSPTYYGELFKKLTGFTPHDYVNHKRIETAEKLIRKTNDTVLDIALKCGFNSSTSFNRVFKSVMKTTPMKYRKRLSTNVK